MGTDADLGTGLVILWGVGCGVGVAPPGVAAAACGVDSRGAGVGASASRGKLDKVTYCMGMWSSQHRNGSRLTVLYVLVFIVLRIRSAIAGISAATDRSSVWRSQTDFVLTTRAFNSLSVIPGDLAFVFLVT